MFQSIYKLYGITNCDHRIVCIYRVPARHTQ